MFTFFIHISYMGNSEKLWAMMKEYGNNLHTYKTINIEKLDGKPFGLFAWEQLKSLLSQHGLSYGWSSSFMQIRDRNIEQTSETAYRIFNKKLDNRVETSHYLIQHLRIPYMKTATLTTIAQIAYNAGQLRSHFNKVDYLAEFLSDYSVNKLDELKTYVNQETIDALDKYLTDDKLAEIQIVMDKVQAEFLDKKQTGGDEYYGKYMKYKQKYLNKKR